jgi:hypothetical protein
MADEEPQNINRYVSELLESDSVRFHLKHLVLSTIGQINEPHEALLKYVKILFEREYWRFHILENVLWGKVPFVIFFCKNSILAGLLNSSEQVDVNIAVNLLRSISEYAGDIVAETIAPFIREDYQWLSLVLGAFPFYPHLDSENLFKCRIQLFKFGYSSKHIAWGVLLDNTPGRAITLMRIILEEEEKNIAGGNSTSQLKRYYSLETWEPKDLEKLRKLGLEQPVELLENILPLIDRLSIIDSHQGYNLEDWMEGERYSPNANRPLIKRGVVEAVLSASRTIARNDPSGFLYRVDIFNGSESIITQEVLLSGFCCLPTKYSDVAVEWLIGSSSRLAVGSGFKEPKWAPTCRLIKRHSIHCSDEKFKQLENFIFNYHEVDEKRNAENVFHYVKVTGKAGVWYGAAQYHLLPCLDEGRICFRTKSMIGQLKLKFSEYQRDRFLESRPIVGGTVTSPLREPWKLSDNAWLSIVKNKELEEENSSKWTQIDQNTVAESTVRSFCGALRTAAKYAPERFGKLALRFPPDVHLAYISAILESFQDTKPPQMAHVNRECWQPATITTIEAFLKKYRDIGNRETALQFCWFIRERASDEWSKSTIDTLVDLAENHSDPAVGEMAVYRTEEGNSTQNATVHSLETNMLNCVRGVAVLAISSLLKHDHSVYSSVKRTLEAASNDKHPSVRMAVIEACLSIYHIDVEGAVKLFCRACADDPRVAACQMATYFFKSATPDYKERLIPLVDGMFLSEMRDVSYQGATEICARWIFYGFYETQMKACIIGSDAQRSGAAAVAAQLLSNPNYTEKCIYLLRQFVNDECSNVRQELSYLYRDSQVLANPYASSFLVEYINSKAFIDDPTSLLHALNEYSGPLSTFSEYIKSIACKFAGALKEEARDISTAIHHDVKTLVPLMLRLYEEALEIGKDDIIQLCLDCFDLIFENRIGHAIDFLKEIDK